MSVGHEICDEAITALANQRDELLTVLKGEHDYEICVAARQVGAYACTVCDVIGRIEEGR